MFDGAAAFNQDIGGWDVLRGETFVSARRIQLVCYDACYNSSFFYCLRTDSLQDGMFAGSGMNHFIGGGDGRI